MNALPNKQYDLRRLTPPDHSSKDPPPIQPQKENKAHALPTNSSQKKTSPRKSPAQITTSQQHFEPKNTVFSAEKPKSAKTGHRKIKKSKSRNWISKKKENWTDDEDTILLSLVKKYGPKNWTEIATHFNHRLGKQCRERWYNHLSPDVKKSKWTQQEDLILLHAYIEFGSRWSVISNFLPGRTDNAIKNHYNSTIKRKLKNNELDFSVSPIKFDLSVDIPLLPEDNLSNDKSPVNKLDIQLAEKDSFDDYSESPDCHSLSVDYQMVPKEEKQVPETAISALKIRLPLINPNLLGGWEGPTLLNDLFQKSGSKCREDTSPKVLSFGDLLESLRNVTVDLLSFKEF